MGEILSRAEVDAILGSVEPSLLPTAPASAAPAQTATWRTYDFRGDPPVPESTLNLVRAFHVETCHRFKERFQRELQTTVDVQPVGACQIRPIDFLTAIKSPYLLCQINQTGQASSSLLVWSRDLVQATIYRMLGGTEEGAPANGSLELTSIENRLFGRFNQLVKEELALILGEPLDSVAPLPRLEEASSELCGFPLHWFSFEVRLGRSGSFLHLGIPKLPSKSAEIAKTPESLMACDTLDGMPAGIRSIKLQLEAILASIKLKGIQIAGLKVGELIETGLSTEQSIFLRLNDRDLFQGKLKELGGRFAVQLTRPDP